MKQYADFVVDTLEKSVGIVIRKKTVKVYRYQDIEVIMGGLVLHPHLLKRFEDGLKKHPSFVSVKSCKITKSIFGDIIVIFKK